MGLGDNRRSSKMRRRKSQVKLKARIKRRATEGLAKKAKPAPAPAKAAKAASAAPKKKPSST